MNLVRSFLIGVAVAASCSSAIAAAYTELVIFGDSASDTGNVLSKLGIPSSPPYFEGRLSNGPIWAERLADRMGLPNPVASELGGPNYAWAGATTGSVSAAIDVPDMRRQVRTFLDSHTPSPDQLFVLYGGYNDLNLGQEDGAIPADLIAQQLTILADNGARNFLVPNLDTINAIGRARESYETFNRVLPEKLDAIRLSKPDVSIIEFDTDHLFAQIASNPAEFGFTELNRPACRDCSYGEVPNPTQIVDNVDEYLFWDLGHNTARGHEIHGDAVFNRLVRSNGDLNQDGALGEDDIDLLSLGIRIGSNDVSLEINEDWLLNDLDRMHWVHVLKGTWFGDANLDGEFDSSDMVQAFAVGKYETGEVAGWSEGDWNGDGVFDSSDMVTAFADGGYEQGLRTDAVAVPEPGGWLLMMMGVASLLTLRRRCCV